MVMRNLLRHPGPYIGLYDLKGCADDKTLERHGRKIKVVNKRVWHVHMWCGDCAWSPDRVVYHAGKVAARELSITVTDKQRNAIMERLRSDTAWLAQQNLMDYSLLLAMRKMSREEFDRDPTATWARRGGPGELRQPLLHVGEGDEAMLVYIGIIDFLQKWTTGKQIAMCLKVLERNKATIPPKPYAERFYDHFSRNIQGGAQPLDALAQDAAASRPSEKMMNFYSCVSFEDEALKLGVETPKASRSSTQWWSCFSGICGR